jgi:hypothetical protein
MSCFFSFFFSASRICLQRLEIQIIVNNFIYSMSTVNQCAETLAYNFFLSVATLHLKLHEDVLSGTILK